MQTAKSNLYLKKVKYEVAMAASKKTEDKIINKIRDKFASKSRKIGSIGRMVYALSGE